MIIAIDGPSGAGKSTIAKLVAKQLGFSCLDTGAMYRAIAWGALNGGVALDDAEGLGALAREKEIAFGVEEGNPIPSKVFLDGEEITSLIRTGEIDKAVSPVSATPAVREALVDQQRRIGAAGDFVVEGRDIGTVVFPDAAVKVFLTASDEERARRRVAQNIRRGVEPTDFDEVLADIIRRDEVDSNRATSPLRPADDAMMLDSTNLTIDEVVATICKLAEERR